MNVNDDDRTTDLLLERLRQHADGTGEVDVAALVSGGVDLRAQRPQLERLCRKHHVLLEFAEDRIDRITLRGAARGGTAGATR